MVVALLAAWVSTMPANIVVFPNTIAPSSAAEGDDASRSAPAAEPRRRRAQRRAARPAAQAPLAHRAAGAAFPFRALCSGCPARRRRAAHRRSRPSDARASSASSPGATASAASAPRSTTRPIYVPEFGLRYFDHRQPRRRHQPRASPPPSAARNYVYSGAHRRADAHTAPIGVVFDVLFDRRADLLYNGLGSHTYSAAPASRYMMNAIETRLALRMRPLPWLELLRHVRQRPQALRQRRPHRRRSRRHLRLRHRRPSPASTHGTTFVRAGPASSSTCATTVTRASAGLLVAGVVRLHARHRRRRRPPTSGCARSSRVPINLWARTHVLWLQAATVARLAERRRRCPFSELPTLGGPDDLRGFRFQDFRDYTSFYVDRRISLAAVDVGRRRPLRRLRRRVRAELRRLRRAPHAARHRRRDAHRRLAAHFCLRVQLGYGFGEGVNFSLSGNAP